jgi:hypothetical protein
MAEPNDENKMSIDDATSEARYLLQNLSALLVSCARKEKWDAADLVAKEISSLQPQSSRRRHNLAVTSAEYSDRFGTLLYLLYFGAHACLVDLAVAESPASVPARLLDATWPYYETDLSELLGVYAQATLDDSAAGWTWGWEPPHPLRTGFTPRAADILAYGFVAVAIAWPDTALFSGSNDAWLATQLEKLGQAAGGASQLKRLLGKNSLVNGILNDPKMMQKLVDLTGGSLTSSDALRRLLNYLQETFVSIERKKIRESRVPQDVITGFMAKLANQYDANKEKAVIILQTLDLLRSGSTPSDLVESPPFQGVNTVIDKQWFITSQSDSWSHIAEEYGNGLRQMQVGFTVRQLSENGTLTDVISILAPDSPLQASKGVLLVDTDVEWLPSSLQALVQGSESSKQDHSAPDVFLRVAGQRLPIYRVWVGGTMKPVMLFIERSNSAHAIRMPWNPQTGWIPSATREVKIRLQVPSQETEAMDALLKQNPAWLEEKAHTDEEKKAYLKELVWLQAYQQLAFCPGSTPGVLRLDLPNDEDEALPQSKDESAE